MNKKKNWTIYEVVSHSWFFLIIWIKCIYVLISHIEIFTITEHQKLTAFFKEYSFLNTYISMFNFEPNYDPFDPPSLPRGKNNIIIYINK